MGEQLGCHQQEGRITRWQKRIPRWGSSKAVTNGGAKRIPRWGSSKAVTNEGAKERSFKGGAKDRHPTGERSSPNGGAKDRRLTEDRRPVEAFNRSKEQLNNARETTLRSESNHCEAKQTSNIANRSRQGCCHNNQTFYACSRLSSLTANLAESNAHSRHCRTALYRTF